MTPQWQHEIIIVESPPLWQHEKYRRGVLPSTLCLPSMPPQCVSPLLYVFLVYLSWTILFTYVLGACVMTITDARAYARAAARHDPLHNRGNAYDPDRPSDERPSDERPRDERPRDERPRDDAEYDPARPLLPPPVPRRPPAILVMSTSAHNCLRPENVEQFLKTGSLDFRAAEFHNRSSERTIHVRGVPLRVMWSVTSVLDGIARGMLAPSDIRGFVIESVRYSQLRRSETKLMNMLGSGSYTISMVASIGRAPSWMRGSVHVFEYGTPAGLAYAASKLKQMLGI